MEQNKTQIGEFISSAHNSKKAMQPSESVQKTNTRRKTLFAGWTEFQDNRRKNDTERSYKKLLQNTAICAILALCIWGLKAADTRVTNIITDGISQATSSEMVLDEDLGRLKFVNSEADLDGLVEVNATEYSLPVEGEVVSSFADNGQSVKIRAEERAQVCAILSGTVARTDSDSVVIQNDNGTQTTYLGVVPGVKAGDAVKSAQMIGQLAEEVLSLETVGSIGYLDSLDQKELSQTIGN